MSLRARLAARARRVREALGDSGQAAVYIRQLLRGNRTPARQAVRASASAPPVLLIHGFLATRGSLHLLVRRLAESGRVVMTYKLGRANLGDIRDSAGLVARKVESIVEQTGVQRVDLVGHSMGGLVGLYYVKRLGGRRRVRRLVLLGTPARGTWSAILGLPATAFGRAPLQLLPGSAFLRDLEEGPLPPDVVITVLAGARDFFAPIAQTVLEGVRHVVLPASHSGLLVDEAVARAVGEALGGAEALGGGPEIDDSPTSR